MRDDLETRAWAASSQVQKVISDLVLERHSSVELREDEAALLKDSKRCANCGHLWALHNAHCCAFCTIPGCKCECSAGADYSEGELG